jgi:hypothetical protein
VYAPLCINAITFTIFASAIASGRRPSKLTIKTRSIGGTDVGVNMIAGVGISVAAGGGVLLAVKTAVGGESTVGGREETDDPQPCRKNARRVKS